MKLSNLFLIAALVFAFACSNDPEPINFGKDQCDFCKMTIADSKFGAELVTDKGRIYKFDAVECMVPYINENEHEYAHVLAVPYDEPGALRPAENLQFIISDSIRSPMGANLLVITNNTASDKFAGQPYDWSGIQEYLLNEDW